ncbi:MAG TPA: hypothetical protein VGI87_03190 [Solirubrobacteraceae bacterium]
MAAGPPAAAGERSVSVGGDVVGSLIVTGDNNNVRLVLGSEHGALLEQLSRSERPTKRLRPGPLRSVPAPPRGSVDRADEARAILDSLAAGDPVNVHGPRGVGKTHAVLRALSTDDSGLAGGAVYLYAPGPLDDVMQTLFEAWYECEPPFKPSTVELRRDLAAVRGVVALDSVELEPPDVQQVLLDATGCRVVFASRHRLLSDGTAIALQGLRLPHALIVLEQELGRPVTGAERHAGERICTALDGHPLRIREAVASARDAERPLHDLAEELSAADPELAVAEAKLEASGPEGRALLAALGLFGDATVGREHLEAIVGGERFEALVMEALRRRDIRAHSPRYNLGATLAPVVGPDAEAGKRALAHFTRWATENRGRPEVVMSEGAALIALLRWGLASGRAAETIELGRTIDSAFALGRRFGGWGQVLELVHDAAIGAGDREAEAWALHQQGTRALCLGDSARGTALLQRALKLRRDRGDELGASHTARNLMIARRPRWFTRWIIGHAMLTIGIVVALFAGGAVAAATLLAGGSSTPSSSSLVSAPARSVRTGTGSSAAHAHGANAVHTHGSGAAASAGSGPGAGGSATRHQAKPGVTATPPPGHDLSVAVSGPGSVTVDPGAHTCTASCTFRTTGTMTLTPATASQSTFTGWGGDCGQTDASAPCSLTMTADRSASATFQPPPTLTVAPSGGETVTSKPSGIDCPATQCSAPFRPGEHVELVSTSGRAFWSAPGCAPPPSQSSSSSAQSSSTSTAQTTTGTVRPSATALPPAGSTTCLVALQGPETVAVSPAGS